jgi:NAD(P)-dependent dehydrogenase (short-subunit alcohol dehydrogenase family)
VLTIASSKIPKQLLKEGAYISMEQQFNGRVAIVTGAGSGIGRACAIAFAQEGARVVAADVDTVGNEQTVAMIRHNGGDSIAVHCDVSLSDNVQQMVRQTIATYGRLDYACNNAGVAGMSKPSGEYPEDEWERVIAINLTGVWLCMRYQIPEMLKTGGGAIVNIASILGHVGFANAPAYVAAKHGVVGLTKSAAIEYGTQGIRINAVCPAFIYTPLLEHAGIVEGSDIYNHIAERHPMKRMGTPEEVADMVTWLCSDKASFVTGVPMLIDGGYVAQ